ncbi:hypothetical protein G6F58_013821 [Rhizopus delemar]|nr:hypothetical protein G6F58_013821 [Rhizopus delemar]
MRRCYPALRRRRPGAGCAGSPGAVPSRWPHPSPAPAGAARPGSSTARSRALHRLRAKVPGRAAPTR